jgi:hypothetical protein
LTGIVKAMSAFDPRDEPRANVFLSAVLTVDGASIPIRIRNLSPSGALLEGANLPSNGDVMLRRGKLVAIGNVAWRGEGCCGVRFNSEVVVKDWMKRVVHSGQERVDGIVTALKSGAIPHANSDCDPPTGLDQLVSQLLAVVEEMASLPDMTTEMGEQIVKLEALVLAVPTYADRSECHKLSR